MAPSRAFLSRTLTICPSMMPRTPPRIRSIPSIRQLHSSLRSTPLSLLRPNHLTVTKGHPTTQLHPRSFSTTLTALSDESPTTSPPDHLTEGEAKIYTLVQSSLSPTKLEVQDVSGGCGSMYALDIVSEKFAGLTVIKQHRLVNQVLKEEIKGWHGMQLKTRAP